VLDTTTFAPLHVRQFAVWNPALGLSDSLASFLQNLPTGSFIVHIVTTDGAQGLNENARSVIRSLGSIYIDSLGYRESWLMIYRKGDAPASIKEFYAKAFGGKIIVDTTMSRPSQDGNVLSPLIGPSSLWGKMTLNVRQIPGNAIRTAVLGNGTDTLYVTDSSREVVLSDINAKQYPFIKIGVMLSAGDAAIPPVLRSLMVSAQPATDLALNYQSVHLVQDSVLEGEDLSVQTHVWNAGPNRIDSVALRLDWIASSSYHGQQISWLHDVPPDSIVSVDALIPTTGAHGAMQVKLQIDPDALIAETYENNNSYSLFAFVRSDTITPTFELTIDDRRLYEGDYVSVHPTIRVVVQDNSPLRLVDPGSVDVYLDGRRVLLGNEPDSLFESNIGDVKAQVTVRPTLTDGAHTLALRIRDASGNEAEALEPVRFYSDSELKLMDAFAYPNPFAEVTTISFVLSGSDVPDQITLRLFSVAGRLLWKRELRRSEISIGLNKVVWDGRDSDGDQVSNGLYFLRIEARSDARSAITTTKLVRMR